jgi:hypothetical protein
VADLVVAVEQRGDTRVEAPQQRTQIDAVHAADERWIRHQLQEGKTAPQARSSSVDGAPSRRTGGAYARRGLAFHPPGFLQEMMYRNNKKNSALYEPESVFLTCYA